MLFDAGKQKKYEVFKETLIKSLVKGKWSYIKLSQELYKLKFKIQAWRLQKSFKSCQSLNSRIKHEGFILFSPFEYR